MKVIAITGGSRGIGAIAAIECARRNVGVVLTYNQNEKAACRIVRRIVDKGGTAVALPLNFADISTFGSFKDALENAVETTWGEVGLSGLVNNAGYGVYNPIVSTTEAEFDGLMNVHLKGPFFLTQALLALMRDGACIVNLTSATTRVATPGVAPYAAFKGGLEVLTRYMAAEFSARRICVKSVSPSPIRTELGGALNNEFESLLASQTALGQVGE